MLGLGLCAMFMVYLYREYEKYSADNNRFLDHETKEELDLRREKARALQQERYLKLVQTEGEAEPLKEAPKKKKTVSKHHFIIKLNRYTDRRKIRIGSKVITWK